MVKRLREICLKLLYLFGISYDVMKRTTLLVLLAPTVLVLTSGVPFRDALRSDPYNAAGNYHPYTVPEYRDTKPPHGYKPFYVSHYGRHGSRFLTGSSAYLHNLVILDSLSSLGLLTTEGEALRQDMHLMRDAHEGQDGILTQVGSREHQGISRRLYRRAERVFRQKDRREVLAQASPVTRCVQSAANFLDELKANSPGLNVELYSGERYLRFLSHDARGATRDSLNNYVKSVIDSMTNERFKAPGTGERIFNDVPEVRKVLGKESFEGFMYSLLHESSIAKCLDVDVDPFSHFTEEEIYSYGVIYNGLACFRFARTMESGHLRDTATGIPLLRDFIVKADEALQENSRKCADLRFGHDTGIGAVMSLIQVDGYDKTPALAETYEIWPAYKYIPMGTNCQMIFYGNRKGDVLVKILLNEEETTIPAVPAFTGPYYRWQDLRKYFCSLCGLD